MQAPSSSIEEFQPVARLIAPDSPGWLASLLMRWAPTIFLNYTVEKRQPTRAEMKRILNGVHQSAAFLQRALGEPAVREFLDIGDDRPLGSMVKFDEVLSELNRRAANAAKVPALVNSSGKTKAGQGKALPDSAISAQTYCALLIAETWRSFRGEYPPPQNVDAAKATEILWKLSGGDKQTWGNNPLGSWRHHFKKASKLPAEQERAEIRRHLRESEYAATHS